MTDIEHSLFTFIHEGAQEVCEENDLQLIALNASPTRNGKTNW